MLCMSPVGYGVFYPPCLTLATALHMITAWTEQTALSLTSGPRFREGGICPPCLTLATALIGSS